MAGLALFIVVCGFFASAAGAANIVEKADHWRLSGPIEEGDLAKLERAVGGHGRDDQLACPQKGLVLDSPGGNFLEGLKIGEFVRKRQLWTLIRRSGQCQSACAFAFLGGYGGCDEDGKAVRRYIEPGAKLGFHAPFVPAGIQTTEAARLFEETINVANSINAFMQTMQVPLNLIPKLLKNEPDHSLFSIDTVEYAALLKIGVVVPANGDTFTPVDITADGLRMTRSMAANKCLNGYRLSRNEVPSEHRVADLELMETLQAAKAIETVTTNYFTALPVRNAQILDGSGEGFNVVYCIASAFDCGYYTDSVSLLGWTDPGTGRFKLMEPDEAGANQSGNSLAERIGFETLRLDINACAGQDLAMVPPETPVHSILRKLDEYRRSEQPLFPENPEVASVDTPSSDPAETVGDPPVNAPGVGGGDLSVGSEGIACNPKAGFVNLRAGPSASTYSIVRKVENHTAVTIAGHAENPETGHRWLEVEVNGSHGYIDSDWVSVRCSLPQGIESSDKAQLKQMVVCNSKAKFVNLRTGPNSRQHAIVDKLTNGVAVQVIGEAENPESGHLWLKVKVGSLVGFVDSDWIRNSCSQD